MSNNTFSCPMCGHAHDGGARECASCGEPIIANIWRDGDVVVLRRSKVQLPAVCFLTGQPTDNRSKLLLRPSKGIGLYVLVALSLLPPLMFIALPVLFLLFLIDFRAFRRRTVKVSMSEDGLQKMKRLRRFSGIAPICLLLLMVAVPIFEHLFAKQGPLYPRLVDFMEAYPQLSIVLLLTTSIAALTTLLIGFPLSVLSIVRFIRNDFGLRLVKVDGLYFHLNGAHPRLLELLPEFNHQNRRPDASESQPGDSNTADVSAEKPAT